MTLVSDLIKTWKVWTQQCALPDISPGYFALSDVSHGNPQKQVFKVLSCKQHKVTFLFSPKFLSKCPPEIHWVAVIWVQGLNLLSEQCVRNWYFLEESRLVLGYDLALLLFYAFQWWCKSPEKTFGRKHQRIMMDRGKILSKKLIKERKKSSEICSLLYWRWLFCFK